MIQKYNSININLKKKEEEKGIIMPNMIRGLCVDNFPHRIKGNN